MKSCLSCRYSGVDSSGDVNGNGQLRECFDCDPSLSRWMPVLKEVGVRVERELTVHMPAHQVLVDFDNDSDATLFEEWLIDLGLKEFKDWKYKG